MKVYSGGHDGAFVALFWLLLSLIQLRPLSYMTSCYVINCFYKKFKQKSNAYYSKETLVKSASLISTKYLTGQES